MNDCQQPPVIPIDRLSTVILKPGGRELLEAIAPWQPHVVSAETPEAVLALSRSGHGKLAALAQSADLEYCALVFVRGRVRIATSDCRAGAVKVAWAIAAGRRAEAN